MFLSSGSTGFLTRWEPVQLHFKARRIGGGDFGRMEPVMESAPLSEEWCRWGALSASAWTAWSGVRREPTDLSFTFCFNVYSFFPFLLPHPFLPSVAKLMALCQILLMHLLCRFRLSHVCRLAWLIHLWNIHVPSHKDSVRKVNKSSWLWSNIRHWITLPWNLLVS